MDLGRGGGVVSNKVVILPSFPIPLLISDQSPKCTVCFCRYGVPESDIDKFPHTKAENTNDYEDGEMMVRLLQYY